MPFIIDSVVVDPHPIPASAGAVVCASCRVVSDHPVTAVTAYLPDGPSLSFTDEGNGIFSARGTVPYGATPGIHDILLVARDQEGNTARKSISVTLV